MSFYRSISAYYDDVFATSPDEMAFMVKQFSDLPPDRESDHPSGTLFHRSGDRPAGKRLLDLGCGTGLRSVYFAGPGQRVTGIDRDPAMIERARQREAVNAEFLVMDMLDLSRHFQLETFAGALCLGNSLAHLEEPADMVRVLTMLQPLIKPGGLLAVQILNYDRILDDQVTVLPEYDSTTVHFIRRYSREGRHLRFMTSLLDKAANVSIDNEILIYPLRRQELALFLEDAGFTNLRFYGGYNGEAYGRDAFITLCLATA